MLLLAAKLPAPLRVIVVNTPPPSIPDPLAREGLHVAWNTFDVTVVALIIAAVAAVAALWALYVAIRDAERNSLQLKLLIEERNRKPILSVALTEHKRDVVLLGEAPYTSLECRFIVRNAEAATKSASSIFVNMFLPDVVITETRFNEQQEELRKRESPQPLSGPGRAFQVYAEQQALQSRLLANVALRALPVTTAEIFDDDDIDKATAKGGYRNIRFFSEPGDVLLPGLKQSISSRLTLYVPNDAPPLRWQIRCNELNEWQSGEVDFRLKPEDA